MTSRRGRLVVLASAAGLVGCALLVPSLAPGPHEHPFDHQLHVQQYELACVECHAGSTTEALAGMPALGRCRECHDQGEEETADYFAAITSSRPVDAPFISYTGPLRAELLPAHATHAAAGVSCTTCHGDVGASKATDPTVVPSMDTCTSCHETAAPAKTDCSACHRTLRADVAPPSHGITWKRGHGDQVRFGWTSQDDLREDACRFCHRPDDCVTCHQREQPRSHDAFFVARGHGMQALGDRAACATCHKPDSCSRCHQETRPQSHVASFGGARAQHCTGCHVPVESQQGCGLCHASTPSHQTATPLPPTHTLGMNCRQCHGVGQPLPHVDNGMECVSCHR
jgi:hypothetical protein